MTLQEFTVDEFLNEFEVYIFETMQWPLETMDCVESFLQLEEIDYKIIDQQTGTFAADMSGYQ